MCCPDYPPYLSWRRWPDTKTPHHDASFSFLSNHSRLLRLPAVAAHFSLEPFSLKLDDAHLTFAMVPSLLHISIYSDCLKRTNEYILLYRCRWHSRISTWTNSWVCYSKKNNRNSSVHAFVIYLSSLQWWISCSLYCNEFWNAMSSFQIN